MKKMMCGVLCAALLACSAGAAAAGSYTVTVDGAALDLSGKTPFVSQDKVMVPLRPVAEALSCTVTWTAEDAQRVEIDNGVVRTWVDIGVDSYCRTSSTAIGMGAPVSFGAAPVAMDNTTYVPVDLFAMMGDTVETDGTDITLSAMESQTQIPNPIVAYDTLEKAVAAAGVKAVLPAFPAEWRQVEFSVIGGTLLQVIYTDGTDTAVFRAAAGDGDTSGDYNAYDSTWTVGDVTLKGSGDQAVLALCQRDGVSYSLSFSAPVAAAACLCLVIAGLAVIPSWSGPAAGPPVQVTNPMVQSEDLEALRAAAPFALSVPTDLPEGWKVESTTLIGGTLAQVVYSDGTNTVTYRMAEGTEDVSGDYNAYPWTAETEADGVTVTLKGQEEDAVLLAVWTDGQYSYALACSAPLTAEEATAMASGVAPLE